jgi:hypothetical protein
LPKAFTALKAYIELGFEFIGNGEAAFYLSGYTFLFTYRWNWNLQSPEILYVYTAKCDSLRFASQPYLKKV